MNIWDVLILLAVAGAAAAALLHIRKRKHGGCSGCCEGCTRCPKGREEAGREEGAG